MIKFLSDDIWVTIKKLAEKSKHRKVAVAYFGNGAASRLKLKRGDTLILAISLKNVKAGQVNPFEVEKLIKKGVDVYNIENLHSKIFLFDKSVIVGSANVSENSEVRLIESGVLTNDPKVIAASGRFIADHCIEKVEQDYLEVCKKNYSPTKYFGSSKKIKSNDKVIKKLSRLWVLSTRYKNINSDISERAQIKFEDKITNKRVFSTEKITYPPKDKLINEVKEGDIIIEIFNQNERAVVYTPKRALGVTWNKPKTHKVLIVEERINPKTKGWKVIESELRKQGIRMITKNTTREIKNENTKRVLLKCLIVNHSEFP